MARIAIFAALRWECRPVLRQMRGTTRQPVGDRRAWRGHTAHHDVLMVQTGVGVQRAAAAAEAATAAERFDLLVSTGCAGALAPQLVAGDLAIATAIIAQSVATRFETDAAHRARAHAAAERAALPATLGLVVCSERVLASGAAKREAARTGAIAVEMEGASIGARAAHLSLPFLSVRAILDTADSELDESDPLVDPHSGKLKPLAVARYLARGPAAWTHLRSMQRMMNAAQETLNKFFQVLLADAWPAERLTV